MRIPKPDYNLGIGGGSHGAMTGRQLEKIEEVLIAERPDWVLVYGDTNSTLAGCLAAVKLHMPVAHVEAGLRSFNRRMPEEINRVLTDHISTILFAPTETAKSNLLAEGVDAKTVYVVGDVMYDAALFYAQSASKPDWFDGVGVEREKFVLCTVHRAENVDDPIRLKNIINGLTDAGVPIILPMHPRTKSRLNNFRIRPGPNVHVTEPVGYLDMIWLEKHCRTIATDSGGVQKEAFFQRKPCVTLRDETEWVELVDSGWNQLVGSDRQKIAAELASDRNQGSDEALYGVGDAAERVCEILKGEFERVSDTRL